MRSKQNRYPCFRLLHKQCGQSDLPFRMKVVFRFIPYKYFPFVYGIDSLQDLHNSKRLDTGSNIDDLIFLFSFYPIDVIVVFIKTEITTGNMINLVRIR